MKFYGQITAEYTCDHYIVVGSAFYHLKRTSSTVVYNFYTPVIEQKGVTRSLMEDCHEGSNLDIRKYFFSEELYRDGTNCPRRL